MELQDVEKRVIEQLFDSGKTIDEIADITEKTSRIDKFLVQEHLFQTGKTQCRFYSITGLESLVTDGFMDYAASVDSVSELASGAGMDRGRVKVKLRLFSNIAAYKDKLKPTFDWENNTRQTAGLEMSIIDKAIKAEAEKLDKFLAFSTPEGMNKALVTMATASETEDREYALDILTKLFDRSIPNTCGKGTKPNIFYYLGIDIPEKPSWFDERFMQALYIKTNLDMQKKTGRV